MQVKIEFLMHKLSIFREDTVYLVPIKYLSALTKTVEISVGVKVLQDMQSASCVRGFRWLCKVQTALRVVEGKPGAAETWFVKFCYWAFQ